MFERFKKPAGFRLSALDLVILVVGASLCVYLSQWIAIAAVFLAVIVIHFFLFCNVFRIRRSFELFWAATFVANVFLHSTFDALTASSVLMIQIPITALLIILEMLSSRYHGIFWKRINPGYIPWWQKNPPRDVLNPGMGIIADGIGAERAKAVELAKQLDKGAGVIAKDD